MAVQDADPAGRRADAVPGIGGERALRHLHPPRDVGRNGFQDVEELEQKILAEAAERREMGGAR